MKLLRFRIWHLFALVGLAATGMWLITQVGMETAEIEIIKFNTWPRIGVDPTDSRLEVANVEFKYVQPEELSHTSLNLFFSDPAFTESKNIQIGSRIKFRYRAQPILWLKPTPPDPIAIRSLGLNPDDVEELITAVHMIRENE